MQHFGVQFLALLDVLVDVADHRAADDIVFLAEQLDEALLDPDLDEFEIDLG